MAARFIRAVGIRTHGGGDLELTELQLYNGNTRVDTSAALTCTAAPISGTVAGLKDDSTSTGARFAAADVRAAGFAFVWDFGAGNTNAATGLRLGSASSKNRFAAEVTLEQSSNGVDWSDALKLGQFIYPGDTALTPPPGGESNDPYYSAVEFLLRANAALVDDSLNPKAISVVGGSVSINTTAPMFGAGDLRLNGSGHLLVSDNALKFGTGDFTIDMDVTVDTGGPADQGVFHLSANSTGFNNSYSGALTVFFYLGKWTLACAGSYTVGTVSRLFDTRQHIEVSRSGSTVSLFVDGVLAAQRTDTSDYQYPNIAIGLYYDASYRLTGRLDNFRITKGLARHTANFTPPTGEPTTPSTGALEPYSAATSAIAPTEIDGIYLAAGLVAPMSNTRSVPQNFTGRVTIAGTVKEDLTPTDLPLSRRVRLVHERSGVMVAETWSDSTTGAYVFTDLVLGEPFTIYALDHVHNYRAVIADNIHPIPA